MSEQTKSHPPKKIYLQWFGDSEDTEPTPTPPEDAVTWCSERVFDQDIEYVRSVTDETNSGLNPELAPDPYAIRIGGEIADPYRIAHEYQLDPIMGAALKKLLRCGRKHKSAESDAREVISTVQRWLEINGFEREGGCR